MIPDDPDVRAALRSVAPTPQVPPGLVAGARRKRARTRAAYGAVAGVGALAVLAGIGLPGLIGTSGLSDSAGAGNPPTRGAQAPSVAEPEQGKTPVPGSAATGETAPSDAHSAPSSSLGRADASAALSSQELGWAAILGAGPGNQVVSPSSLALSLAMAAEGADGASKASIDRALGMSGHARSEAYSALRRSLATYETPAAEIDLVHPPKQPAIHLATRFLTVERKAEPEFVQRILRYFEAPTEEATLAEAQANLDAWINENTGGLIEKSAIEVDPQLRWVTQDAVLFSAAWATPFTEERPVDWEGIGQVTSMTGVVPASFAEGERWTAVRLPMGGTLAGDVILPKAGLAPTDLTAAELAAADEALTKAPTVQVDVTMPKLELRSTVDLLEALPDVDLTNTDGIMPGVRVADWVQQSVLRVSGEGTVAAAVTEMSGRESLPQSDQALVVDRPYVFRVTDTATAWPLFLASVVDPTK